ncbi:MAG: hypothetical protein IPJ65_02360 [Archangiaceae bacterium]|nr:hypothetical protein [Archangiaceae bacterium]
MKRVLGVLSLLGATAAAAHPRALPMSYFASTEPKGEVELEQYVDLVPTVARNGSGDYVGYLETLLATELEYGITDRLELGVYVTLVPQPGDGFNSTPQAISGNGMKARLKWSLAEEGSWPIDVALYGELVFNHREAEVELKAIFERQLGIARLALNLVAELESYWAGGRELVLNPSFGVTFEVTKMVHLGLEYWLHLELPIVRPPNINGWAFNWGPHHYVGPAVMLDFGRVWWAAAAYVRVSQGEHALVPGDAYGQLWVRTVVGVTL